MMLSKEGLLHRLSGVQWFELSLRSIPWMNSLFILLLAYGLAGISWQMWPQQQNGAVPGLLIVAPTPSISSTHRVSSLDAVAASHLFGQSDAPLVAPTQSVINAPETRLSLTLRGIVAISGGGKGRALIAEGSAAEQVYKVGDVLSGGAVLHEVLADKVILKRGSRFETLTLPRKRAELSGALQPGGRRGSRRSTPVTPGPRGAISHQLSTLRDKIAGDPQQALDLVQVQPVMEGGMLKGYRVNPGKQRRLFHGTGLRAGDVVTSVNGISLSDPAQMATLFAQFKSAARFNLEVERGGRPTSLTIDLGK